MNSRRTLESLDMVQRLLSFTKHLIEGIKGEDEAKDDPYEFEESQTYVAKLVHSVDCKDALSQFQAISTLKESFDKGGIQRMKFTIPSVVMAVYKLLQKSPQRKHSTTSAEEDKDSTESAGDKSTPSGIMESIAKLPILKIYQFVYQAIDSIGSAYPETALRLFLQGVLSMNGIVTAGTDVEELGYQFASQALVLYQDELTDSGAKYRAITLIMGTLQRATFFSSDNFETLTTNATQYCAKLLMKQDQCKAVLGCTHMFFSELIVPQTRHLYFHRKSLNALTNI